MYVVVGAAFTVIALFITLSAMNARVPVIAQIVLSTIALACIVYASGAQVPVFAAGLVALGFGLYWILLWQLYQSTRLQRWLSTPWVTAMTKLVVVSAIWAC